ncbi:T9SS type A sorting domain-containing protein [Flavobacterium sp.]|uniref:T9SS type A sorting domain-containing protein n=1 Tax=Flavobacterium sp. TaxID=239 RepID=UPI0031D83CDD
MKNLFTLFLFGIFYASQAQPKLKFSYDPITGNQIIRELCFGCQTQRPGSEIKEIAAVTEQDLQKFSPGDAISYYPNPVKEELYLSWESSPENFVTSIEVIGMGGQILKTYGNTKNTGSQNIAFQNLSAGVYLVSLSYSSGEQKTIKIIKK